MEAALVLKAARKRAELTRQGLADLAGTSVSAIGELEAGKRSPTVTTMNRLVAACGLQIRASLEPLLAHVDERLDRMLSSVPEVDVEGLERFAGSLNDEPGCFKPFGAPNRRHGPVTWAFDGATALALQGLAVESGGVGLVAVLDDGLRSWLWGTLCGSKHFLSWWEGDLEHLQRAAGDWTHGGLGTCVLRVVEVLPTLVQLVPEGGIRALPVITVDEVERAHPQYAEVLKRWRERDVA
jgi:transcriptional regulator with XRE-family HTH domain